MKKSYELVETTGAMPLVIFCATVRDFSMHYHSAYELIYVLQGSAFAELLNQSQLVKKGDLILINSNEMHTIKDTNEENLLLILQFDKKAITDYMPEMENIKFLNNFAVDKETLKKWDFMRVCMLDIADRFYQRSDNIYQLKVMSIFNELLYKMFSELEYALSPVTDQRAVKKKFGLLVNMISDIKGSCNGKMLLGDIAKKENKTMQYMSRFFKEQTGISFQEYVSMERVRNAVSLLLNTNKTVFDICIECGFSDIRYMNKAFLSEHGCLPAEFRKKYKSTKNHVRRPYREEDGYVLTEDEGKYIIEKHMETGDAAGSGQRISDIV